MDINRALNKIRGAFAISPLVRSSAIRKVRDEGADPDQVVTTVQALSHEEQDRLVKTMLHC